MKDNVPSAGGLHPLLPDAVALHQAGRLTEATKVYELILIDMPGQFDALHMMGVIALQQGRFQDAQQRIAAALEQDRRNAVAMANLSAAYLRNRQSDKALEWGERALEVDPGSIEARVNVGSALYEMGNFSAATPVFQKIIKESPNSALVANLLGSCLLKTGDAAGAAGAFESATLASPTDADSWANFSVALNALGEHQRALDLANKSLSLRSDSSNAFAAQAASLLELGKVDEAIASYREAAKHAPSLEVLCAYANALFTSGLTEEAAEVLRRALAIDASNPAARWILALATIKPICDTAEEILAVRRKFSEMLSELDKGALVPTAYTAVGNVQPFYLAYHEMNNVDLLQQHGDLCASWMKTLPAANRHHEPHGKRGGKIRVGIASAHIRDHSVWTAITKGWATRIDRRKFEVYLFSLGSPPDKVTEQAKQAADFFDGQTKGVAAWIDSIRTAELDVLIYPGIGMDGLTYQLASLRLAPLQATSWGHPETSGLKTIDYFFSGEAFETSDADRNYTEKLIRLPKFGSYEEPLKPKMTNLDFDSLNIPKKVPLLLCPGTPFKYTPTSDWIWAEIAKGVAKCNGKLVFFASSRGSMYISLMARFRRVFKAAGIVFESHVCVLPVLDRPRFYGLMQKSTLMLDTVGFSGFNTALQGLECGMPVLAYEGKFMRGRLASGIIRTMGMHELVATSPQEFIDKAVNLASDQRTIKRLRSEILKRRQSLFFDDAPVRELERFLEQQVTKQRARTAGLAEA